MARGNDGKPRAGIGALIKRYREDQRITQRELAAAAGMSISVLRDLEQGRTRSPRWGTVEELVAVLSVGQAQRAELIRMFRVGQEDMAGRRRPARRRRGIRVDILGPLEIWRDGERLVLGPARQRAVLGLLALHANTVVHREAIIDMLWGERPPPSAVPEVQGYVSRLRKLAGDGRAGAESAGLVTTAGDYCYRLNVPLGQLDLAAFGEAIREAREIGASGDLDGACDRYERALEFWRGEVLADLDLLRDHPAAIEATHRRAEAVLGYAEAVLGCADARACTRVLPHLRELCAREPLNEQAHAWLMTMLAANAQQAAALQTFTDVRRRLDAELGIAPSPALIEVHAQILSQQSWRLTPRSDRRSHHSRGGRFSG